MKECLAYEKLAGSSVRCGVCRHFCKIGHGQVGICGTRQNLRGKLYLLPYGRAAAINIDPIEKKPLFHFLPGSLAFSFGTLGCNLRCANCQNCAMSQIGGLKGQPTAYKNIDWGYDISPAQIVGQAKNSGCQSIAYTYNEPTIFLEYALDTMKLARSEGLKNVWVSNGFMSDQTLDLVIPYLDAINIDIKSFDDKFYQASCGARLQPILDNCERLARAKVWLEITTLIIPTLSDGDKMLERIAHFIKDKLGDFVPWHVSAFSGAISWKLQDLPDTPLAKIKKAYALGKAAGLKYVYAGNVSDETLESTYCPQCGDEVIVRYGYRIARRDKDGKCPKCGREIEGNFKNN